MGKHHVISINSQTEWKEAIKNINHSFGHTWENCYAMQLTTGSKTFLYCYENNDGKIFSPITERKYGSYTDISKPFGFCGFIGIGNHENFFKEWKTFATKKGYVCGYLGLDPIFASRNYFSQQDIYHYDTVHVLDLTLQLDVLYTKLSNNRKRQLRNWSSTMDNLVHDKPALIDFFLTNYRDFFTRVNASSYYNFSEETLSFLFHLDNVILVGAQNKVGSVVAVSVFSYTPYIGEYLFNVCLPEGRHYATQLIWHGVNQLKKLQVPLLNLGGGQGNLAEFKRRFGGKQHKLQCLKQVYIPDIYQELCQLKNVDPTETNGYFPIYRKI